MVLTKSPDATGEAQSSSGVGLKSILRIVKINNNNEAARI